MEVHNTVIQKLFSTSVTLTLPMTEYEVTVAILKADGHKEDDVAPTFAL